jgi:archaellum component FlaF (FlaF/FlaG flagellin family)
LLIPETGVWVEISYDQNYTGWVGSPNTHQDVTDTGDHLYQVVTTDQAAAVSVQKMDGSGDELQVTVYNNGEAVKTASTTLPNGIIDLQVSFATPTPTPTPVLTPIPTLPVPSNATHEVNASAR